MKLKAIAISIFLVHSAFGQMRDVSPQQGDKAILLEMHQAVLAAHLAKDAAAWTALEADTTISANNGEVTFPGRSARQQSRQRYLERTNFDSYQDVKPPVVELSEDGTLGWVIAEVEVVGWTARMDGTIEDVSNTWAWLELYKKGENGWKMVGNVSNSRPF